MAEHPLAKWMEQNAVNQTGLARRAGTHQSVISSVLTGKRSRFSPDVGRRISAATNNEVTLEQLIFPPRRQRRSRQTA